MPNDTTVEDVHRGLADMIDFVDLTLAPTYGDKGTAAIIVEFARLAPRTVLGMASQSKPDAYKALRTHLVEVWRKTADELSVQEPVPIEEIEAARRAFELLFAQTPDTVQ